MKLSKLALFAGMVLGLAGFSAPSDMSRVTEGLTAPDGYLIEGRYAAEPILNIVSRPAAYDVPQMMLSSVNAN